MSNVCKTSDTATFAGAYSAEPSVSIRAKTNALLRPVICHRNERNVLVPADAYGRGIVQGLQRAIMSFASANKRNFGLSPNGELNPSTVAATLEILASIGLPDSVPRFPATDEEVCRDVRNYANHIATSAGVAADFTPREVFSLPAVLSNAEMAVSPVLGQSVAGMFSRGNLLLAGALLGGFLLLRR